MMRRQIAERPFLQQVLNLGVALLVVTTLLFLANTLTGAEFKRGNGLSELFDAVVALFTERGTPAAVVFPAEVWTIIRLAVWSMLLLVTIFLVGTTEGRRELPLVLRILLRAILFVLVVSLIFNVLNTAVNTEEDMITTAESAPEDIPFDDVAIPELADATEPFSFTAPESPPLAVLLSMIGVLLAGILLWLLWRWWRYQQQLRAAVREPVNELRDSALQALQELRQGQVPFTDVIRRCYREMTQTVQAQRGVFRQPNVTPREFESRLMEIGLPAAPVLRLTRLFEQVRYGNTTIRAQDTEEAIDSLEQIVAACERTSSPRQVSR